MIENIPWRESDANAILVLQREPDPMLAIRLPPDIETRLDVLAKTTGRTKSFYVRAAILEHLAELEDIYLAEQRLIKVRSGRRKTVPLEKLLKRHGLAD